MSKTVLERVRAALAEGPAELRGLGHPDWAFVLEAKLKRVDVAIARLVVALGEEAAMAYLNAKLTERGWADRV
jgi:hypothetical protein